MKLTAHQFNEAQALGFTPCFHKLTYFAEACFDDNAFDEIKHCLTADPDAIDCAEWNLTDTEWRVGQINAIETAMKYFLNDA